MNNEIDPAIGSWYQHRDDGRLFKVVAVDEDEELVEFQHFDGAIEEVSLNEWRTWDLTVTDAPEDWTGPIDQVQRDDLGYSEVRSAGEQRGLGLERWQEDEEAKEVAGSAPAAAREPPDALESGQDGRADEAEQETDQ